VALGSTPGVEARLDDSRLVITGAFKLNDDGP